MKKRTTLSAVTPVKLVGRSAAPETPSSNLHKEQQADRPATAKAKRNGRPMNLRFEPDLVMQLKLAALKEDRTMTAILSEAAWAYIRERGGLRVLE